jgi:hypothetical protein
MQHTIVHSALATLTLQPYSLAAVAMHYCSQLQLGVGSHNNSLVLW